MDEETQLLIDEFPALAGLIRKASEAGHSAGEIADTISLRVKLYQKFNPEATREDIARLLRTGNLEVKMGMEIPPTAMPSQTDVPEARVVTPPVESTEVGTQTTSATPIGRLSEAIRGQVGTQPGEPSIADLARRGVGRLRRSSAAGTQVLLNELKEAVTLLPQALMTAPSFVGRGLGEFFDFLKQRQQVPVGDRPFLGLTPIKSPEELL